MDRALPMSPRERVLAVLNGEKPDKLPFVDRLELWHRGLQYTDTLPERFRNVPLTEIHRRVGMGRLRFLSYSMRLRGVEVIARFEDKVIWQETDPVVDRFPDMEHLSPDRPGVVYSEIITPAGSLTVEHISVPESLATGARGYMRKHPITGDADYAPVEYILENLEYVPQYERLRAAEAEIGDYGFVSPSLLRLPFQQLLIDYFSTEAFFFALYDSAVAVKRLLDLLDERCIEFVDRLADLDVPYVQFGDNLDGMMTNPRLFREHMLPTYHRYIDRLHLQGKRVGSHTDGHIQPLFALLTESGLDVCESISPTPLTAFTFADVWHAWREHGPIIWGGIPSPILEPSYSEDEFRTFMADLLDLVGDGPIILGVCDMVLPVNLIERVEMIAEMLG
ncbi:MAG: uroporphyrinogen decarboxylase family protein [Caldilineaceae bacterium]